MGLRDIARSLLPGDDHQLAADLASQTRLKRSRAATKAARKGQAWEDKDRERDREQLGKDCITNWD